ncbi:MAG TPA: hypothetical protein VFV87_13535 [Pirellulaceae bacterium]|nr:hypothetical protein [Pirellulaceae bacterium]
MWCSTCQQDVAPLASAEPGTSLRCAKCDRVLAAAPAPEIEPSKAAVPPPRPRILDDWELEAELRGVQRLVGSLKASGCEAGALLPLRFDVPPQESVRPPSEDRSTQQTPAADRPKSHFFAWMLLSLGLATFACGGVLLGWSIAADRADLWPLGMPLALIGQAGLIIGLVLQLDGLWQSNRKTTETLSQLDGELSRVRHATTLLTTTKNASAQSFYAHMAEGASPQLLLADLKGQLDLLAQQMASQRPRK